MTATEQALDKIEAEQPTYGITQGHDIALLYEGVFEASWVITSLTFAQIAEHAQNLANEVGEESKDTEVHVNHVAIGPDYCENTGYHFFPCGKYTPKEDQTND